LETAGVSCEYERSLADLVIMISPFAPMFASELWSALAAVANKTSQYDWVRIILCSKNDGKVITGIHYRVCLCVWVCISSSSR